MKIRIILLTNAYMLFETNASGGIEYEYDNVGNVKATLRTQWVYDNFGKLLRMTYPDNDVVTYRYNTCGDLTKIYKGVYEATSPRTYVSSVNYDVFGRRTAVTYGNGTQNIYAFDTDRQWLSGISVTKANTSLMNRSYQYDDVGNVTGISDINNLSHDYEYDTLDRLIAADGSYGLNSASDHTTYHTETAYDNLWRKTSQLYEKTWPNRATSTYYGYGLTYNYRNDRKYHLNTVVKQSYTNAAHATSGSGLTYPYYYDDKGNMTDEDNADWYCWDEENRLTGVYHDDYSLSSYIYDADGMRTYRNSEYSIKLLVNSQQQSTSSVMYYNLYPSEYYVIHNGNSYTKHVYMDGERVATLLGSNNDLLDDYSNSSITLAGTPFITGNVSQYYTAKRSAKESDLINSLEEVFGYTYSVHDLQGSVIYSGAQVTDLPYYFHRDHLGSAALVTDSVGNVDHRMEYTPDGSLFFQTVTGNYRTPYRFNAKEFDDDTELYYFGARYYDKNLGIWISPDPMAEDYPGVSSYAYCHGNPANRVDLWGMDDYTINSNGYLKFMRKTNAKTTDRIFAGRNHITINKNITNQLLEVRSDYNGNHAIISTKEEAANIFKFFADNTNVEWGVEGFRTKKGNQYLIRTSHKNGYVNKVLNVFKDTDIFFTIHSHPNQDDKGASGPYKYLNNGNNKIRVTTSQGGDWLFIDNIYSSFESVGKKNVPPSYIYNAPLKIRYQYDNLRNKYNIIKISNPNQLIR